MYTKYEEMQVIKQLMQNYATNQKRQYESNIDLLKNQVSNFPLSINSDRTNSEISALQSKVGLLSSYQADYQSALGVINELNKATICYEQGYSPEQLQPGGIAEQRGKEGDRIFAEIKAQNPEYKKIMDEMAYDLFANHDSHIEGLGINFDAKRENLKNQFEAGKLTKAQLIYYTNMCFHLSQNPDYIEYMTQNQVEEQGIRR